MRFEPTLPDERVNVSAHHPLRDAIVLLLGVGGAALAAVLVIALSVDLLVPYISPEMESKLFSFVEFEDDVSAETGVDLRDQQVQELVERLVGGWEDNPYSFEVSVLDQSEPNAFALPGGRIVVTTGLLESVLSENELAFVLGHEIGHFKQRDHLRGLGRGLAVGVTLSVLNLGGAGGVFDLLTVVTGIAGRRFDRDQESGADKIGLELVWRAYGHVSGATEFFDHLPQPSGKIEKQFQSYLSTHPIHSDRVEALNRMAEENDWHRDGMKSAFDLIEQGGSDRERDARE